ncbi:MAG: hypothetical protein ABI374_01595 [Ginsengibacter sp.]
MNFLNKNIIVAIVLLGISLGKPLNTRAQFIQKKWRSPEDSLVVVKSHLSRWHPYGGLHLSSDAEMYYLGPSFEAGVDVNLKTHLALGAYIHYFFVGVNNRDNGVIEKGRMRTFTTAVLIQVNAGAGWYKGFFLGFGLAIQQYADRFKGRWGSWDDKRTTVTLAIRTGYLFPAGLNAIAIEFNGTGPHSYNDGPDSITEIFTQVSVGGRFIF